MESKTRPGGSGFYTLTLLRVQRDDDQWEDLAVPARLAYLQCHAGHHNTESLELSFYEVCNAPFWNFLIDRYRRDALTGGALTALRGGFRDGSIELSRVKKHVCTNLITKEIFDVTMAAIEPEWTRHTFYVGEGALPERLKVIAPIQVEEGHPLSGRRFFRTRTIDNDTEEPIVPTVSSNPLTTTVDGRTKGSVKTESFIRKSGITEDVGPFDTEADALRTAQLLNAYGSYDRDWEAYSVKTTTEEKVL